MKRFLVGLILLITIFITACGKPTNEEIFYEMQKTFNEMESYSCLANITIKGNKSPKDYIAKHIFKNPNKYIIEIIKPVESVGCKTIYDGKQIWLYHPQIEQSLIIKDYEKISSEENMFVGYFLRNFLTTENPKIESQIIETEEYIVLTTEIPGNNKYRKTEKLWVNKKDFIPYKLLILDNNGDMTVQVLYGDFEYDIKLEDDQFSGKI